MEQIKQQKERLKGIEEMELNFISDMARRFDVELSKNASFSETMNIEPDGNLEHPEGLGTLFSTLLGGVPEEGVYLLAKKIKDAFPGFNFSFEKDPHSKWIKYTVKSARK